MEQKLVDLTASTFDQLTKQGTWIIDFWATWCAPCRMQGKLIDEHLDELAAAGAAIGKVNVDEEPELAARFGVMSIPTLLIFKDGAQVRSFVGVQTIDTLKDAIQ
ncbi:MAG: redoxin domain-containing protein [Victivallales bacterium]|nr:redoxin domain-containing protein [Victivallales bacterium]MBQ6471484.1 redoxin domain-containing protein [Victivallales bacterium]